MTTDGPIECDRLQVHPEHVRADDILVCAHTGFHHIHGAERRGALVDILVCEDIAHVYHCNDLVEIARPVSDAN